jgi:hypothetical protein
VTPENVIEKTMAYVSQRLAQGRVDATYFMPEHHAWYHYDPITRQVAKGACESGR